MSDFRADLALGRSLEPPYIPSNLNYTMILWPMIWKKSTNPGASKLSVQHFFGTSGLTVIFPTRADQK